jgi:hypothetical protein
MSLATNYRLGPQIYQFTTDSFGEFVLIVLGCVVLVVIAQHQLHRAGLYARRHIFRNKRASLIESAFPDFCYQPFLTSQDVASLANYAETDDIYGPEIYNLIDDHQGNQHRSVFDLRTASRPIDGGFTRASISSEFLISLSEQTLTPFQLCIEGIANISLWGEDLDIDIDGEFIFSKNFKLTGPNKEVIIKLFDKPLVNFFRTNTFLFTSGALEVKERAIVFHHAIALAPEDIRTTLVTLSKLIELLTRQAQN